MIPSGYGQSDEGIKALAMGVGKDTRKAPEEAF